MIEVDVADLEVFEKVAVSFFDAAVDDPDLVGVLLVL